MGRLPLGKVVATPGALQLLDNTGADPLCLLHRHASGDWGELDPEDRRENELSVREGRRVLSNYPLGKNRIWIITEADRSTTTILLPEEY
jgi:hypothetical protein